MWLEFTGLILSLAIILISCELFTNGIEWLGKKLKLGDGVIGSIFSAVGTCLPETMIPVISILSSNDSAEGVDIGIGAIIGAPFMLSTLAFFLTGLSVLLFYKRRKTGLAMSVNNSILQRDIFFFIIVYSTGITATFFDNDFLKKAIAIFLCACYLFYIMQTVKKDGESHNQLEPLLLSKYLNMKSRLSTIVIQVSLAMGGIVFGAELFVSNIESIAHVFGIPVLVLSLIIAPIATELPEKFNSIIWISKNKDTLALGNITGAMVFQSCIPVSLGLVATSWDLDVKALVSALLALISAAITYSWIRTKGKLGPEPLLAGGGFYAIFILFLMWRGFK